MERNELSLQITLSAEDGLRENVLESIIDNIQDDLRQADILVSRKRNMAGNVIGKGLEIDPNTLLITLVASGGVITNLITIFHSYLRRNEKRSISIKYGDDTLTLTGLNEKQQEELLNNWLSQIDKMKKSKKKNTKT